MHESTRRIAQPTRTMSLLFCGFCGGRVDAAVLLARTALDDANDAGVTGPAVADFRNDPGPILCAGGEYRDADPGAARRFWNRNKGRRCDSFQALVLPTRTHTP